MVFRGELCRWQLAVFWATPPSVALLAVVLCGALLMDLEQHIWGSAHSRRLARSSDRTRRRGVRTTYKSDLHANHHATNAALGIRWKIALFPRNLRLDHIALRSILSLPIMQAKGGGRLLPSYCTCAIDQRNTRYHPSIECSVYF